MSQKIWKWSPTPHEIAVVFGLEAVDAYTEGETSVRALNLIGQVKFFTFNSIPEVNAFIKGVEEAQGALDALPVDDLTQ